MTKNEILTALHKPDDFILAIVLVPPTKESPSTDPFAGGGALPMEAQRMGLESYASDLNPVAVLDQHGHDRDPAQICRQAARVDIDEFQIVPNHIHGIIILVGAGPRACPDIYH